MKKKIVIMTLAILICIPSLGLVEAGNLEEVKDLAWYWTFSKPVDFSTINGESLRLQAGGRDQAYTCTLREDKKTLEITPKKLVEGQKEDYSLVLGKNIAFLDESKLKEDLRVGLSSKPIDLGRLELGMKLTGREIARDYQIRVSKSKEASYIRYIGRDYSDYTLVKTIDNTITYIYTYDSKLLKSFGMNKSMNKAQVEGLLKPNMTGLYDLHGNNKFIGLKIQGPSKDLATEEKIEEDLILELANVYRKAYGLPGLRLNKQMAKAAKAHARDMAQNNYFSHTSRDGRKLKDRVKAQEGNLGPSYILGENIAVGHKDALDVHYGWILSKGHRSIMLSKDFTDLGVGVINSQARPYYGQVYYGKLVK